MIVALMQAQPQGGPPDWVVGLFLMVLGVAAVAHLVIGALIREQHDRHREELERRIVAHKAGLGRQEGANGDNDGA